MCLLYYWNPEYFTVHGSKMILKDNRHTVETNSASFVENTAYGNIEINKNDYIKCIWDFEIQKRGNATYNTNVIGIATNKKNTEWMFVVDWLMSLSDDDDDDDDVLCGYNYGYHIYQTGHELLQTKVTLNKDGSIAINNDNIKPYGCIWKVGDIVRMELDVQNETLKYYVNSIDQGIAVE
eukprot:462582_1